MFDDILGEAKPWVDPVKEVDEEMWEEHRVKPRPSSGLSPKQVEFIKQALHKAATNSTPKPRKVWNTNSAPQGKGWQT